MVILGKAMRFVRFYVTFVASSVTFDCLLNVPGVVIALNTPDCRFMKDIYVCVDIPVSVPPNVTCVVVTASQTDSFTGDFNNPTWGYVKQLDLTGTSVRKVSDNSFKKLSNLTELTLRLPKVLEFQSLAFRGLNALKKLELLEMSMLQTNVFSTLSRRAVPALDEFTFVAGMQDLPPTVLISTSTAKTFFEEGRMKSVKISKTFIGTSFMALVGISLSNIETVNISHSTLILYEDDTLVFPSETSFYQLNRSRPNFKTLDISGSRYPNGPFRTQIYSGINTHMRQWNLERNPLHITFHRYFTLVENIYADGIFHENCIFNISANYSGSSFFWKTTSMRKNNIIMLIGHLVLDLNNTVYTTDWSDNKIHYISPESLSSLIHLKTAKFAINDLHEMQRKPEFEKLFNMQRELEVLDLSHNSLSFIPFQMFDANINIEMLNLSFNSLTTIMFRLMNLRKLKFLDLSGNQIQIIDGQDLTRLQQYMTAMINNTSDVPSLDLNENPVSCTCKSVVFIEWLADISTSSQNKNSYRCIYEGKEQRVDKTAIDKSKYLCKREMVIIVSVTVSSVVVIIILIAATVLIIKHRRRLQMNRVDRFLKEFADQNTDGTFAFLAYASLDEDLVRNHLLLPLNESLKLLLSTNIDTVATGYNFRPGFRITEETFRLVKLSRVFMAVISSNFCRSEYCVAELHEACNQRKHVILVFVGEVDVSDMSPYLREVFRRVVRAKMVVRDNGVVELVPNMEKLCESLILLAISET